MGIATLAQIREDLKIPDASTDDDAFLSGTAVRVSGILEDYLDRKIEEEDISNEILDGDGTDTIRPKYRPVNSVSKLETRSTLGASWTEVDSDDYEVDTGRGRIILVSGIFTAGRRTVRISYNTGYSTVPVSLVQACIHLVDLVYKDSGRGPEGGRRGVGSISLPAAAGQGFIERNLPPIMLKAVRRYRRVHV